MRGVHEGDRSGADDGLGGDARRTLNLVPVWALELASGKPGHVGAGDLRALGRVVQESFLYRREFVRTVLTPLVEQPEQLLEDYRADPRNAESGLRAAAGVLGQVASEDADAFRKIIMVGVWRVVAAGGWPEEGLAAIASCLNMEV